MQIYVPWQVKLGGEQSIDARAYEGLKITKKDTAFAASLPESVLADHTPEGESLQELLCIRCDVELSLHAEGDEDDPIVVALMQGGDLAAMHAAFALASPVDRVSKGCCARCNLTKPWWTNVEACEKAWRRTFAYQCVANHVNVFKLRGFAQKFPGHAAPVCPHCKETLDEAFVEKERLEWENADDKKRKDLTRFDARAHPQSSRGPASTTRVLLPAMLSRPLGSAQYARLVRAGLWAAVCGPDGVWPCGGVWPSEMRVEGRRRPKMAVVAHLYVAV